MSNCKPTAMSGRNTWGSREWSSEAFKGSIEF